MLYVYDKKKGKLVPAHKRSLGTRNVAAKWPIHSEAMAVRPEGVAEAKEIDRQHGVPTDYDAIGRPILRDRSHRKRYCEAHGFYDRNGGYGDASPRNFVLSDFQ